MAAKAGPILLLGGLAALVVATRKKKPEEISPGEFLHSTGIHEGVEWRISSIEYKGATPPYTMYIPWLKVEGEWEQICSVHGLCQEAPTPEEALDILKEEIESPEPEPSPRPAPENILKPGSKLEPSGMLETVVNNIYARSEYKIGHVEGEEAALEVNMHVGDKVVPVEYGPDKDYIWEKSKADFTMIVQIQKPGRYTLLVDGVRKNGEIFDYWKAIHVDVWGKA